MTATPITKTQIFLWVPNIIDYFRVITLIAAFYYVKICPYAFISLYFLSFCLDAIDGPAARKLNQFSRFGAIFDMIIDRCTTAGLLINLAVLYHEKSFIFVMLVILDISSHWFQTQSALLGNNKDKVNHKDLNEKFFILRIYYKVWPVLGIVCLFAEMFLLSLYVGHFYPKVWENSFFLGNFAISTIFYVFKQATSVIQLCSSCERIVEFDVEEKSNKIN